MLINKEFPIGSLGECLDAMVERFIERETAPYYGLMPFESYFRCYNVIDVCVPRQSGKTSTIIKNAAWNMLRKNVRVITENTYGADHIKNELKTVFSAGYIQDRVFPISQFEQNTVGQYIFSEGRETVILLDDLQNDVVEKIINHLMSVYAHEEIARIKLISLKTRQ